MHVQLLPFTFFLADESMQGFYLHTFTFSLPNESMQGFYLHTFTFCLKIFTAFPPSTGCWSITARKVRAKHFRTASYLHADWSCWSDKLRPGEKTGIPSSQKIVLASRLIEPKEQDLMLRNITTLLASAEKRMTLQFISNRPNWHLT